MTTHKVEVFVDGTIVWRVSNLEEEDLDNLSKFWPKTEPAQPLTQGNIPHAVETTLNKDKK